MRNVQFSVDGNTLSAKVDASLTPSKIKVTEKGNVCIASGVYEMAGGITVRVMATRPATLAERSAKR